MEAFSLAKEQQWDPKRHVEKILGELEDGDYTVACWEPGQISPNHCHPHATEIYFCFQGGGKMRTPKETIDVVPGSFVVHPPGEVHEYINGPQRTLRGGRAKGWATPSRLARVNELIEELMVTLAGGTPEEGAVPISVSFLLAPSPAKRAAPEVSLGTLFLAAQLADLVWPTFVLLGIETFSIRPGITAVTPLDFTRYPYSHSLVGLALWGLGLAVVYAVIRRQAFEAAILFAVVLSHWLLDFVSHRPDMPIGLAGPKVGLGLWNSLPATVAVEGALFAAAVAWFVRRRVVTKGFWILIGVLSAVYAANLAGPPPPSVTAVAGSAVVLVPLLWWWANRVEGLPRRG